MSEYGENGIRQSAADLFQRWHEAKDDAEVNLQIGRRWMHHAARMQRERDEARRMLCEMQSQKEQGTPEGWAEEWGWDCFGVTESRSPAEPTDKSTQEKP
jgi:hypothetical protein